MRQRCAFLAVSAVLLAPEMEEIISEEGEAAFYSFFNGLQVWYAAHPRRPAA